MSDFKYCENKISYNTAKRNYHHLMFFYIKKFLLSKDKQAKEKVKKIIKSLKKSIKQNDYPEYVKAHPDTRLAVYTVLFGNYDKIKPIGFKGGNCDYYIITDQDVDENSGWKKLEYEFPENLKKSRQCR